jgi:deazaflavin-dependent oxidoreductase (nitroreductase family)
MSISQRLGAVVVALFAIAFTRAPTLVRLFDPVMRRLLVTRLPSGPNVLLKVRGRRTGRPRTFPVAFLDLGERALLQGASTGVDWVHNLRAAGEAVIVTGGHAETFKATELKPEAAGRLLRDLLAPFPRSRLIRAVVGPVERPPVAVLHYFKVRVDDTLDEYIAVARRQPLFELRRHG